MSAADKYIAEIRERLNKLSESELLYLLTFIKKMFGSR